MELSNLPFKEKSTEELLYTIVFHYFELDNDDLDAIYNELSNRGITKEQIEDIREKEQLNFEIAEKNRLEENKTVSYLNYEKLIIFICAPLILMGRSRFDLSIPELKKENFILKAKQRFQLLLSSVLFYIILSNVIVNFFHKRSQEKMYLEMENIDISEWESNRKWLDNSDLKSDSLR